MIKKVLLTVITGIFIFSGLSFAEIKDVPADVKDSEKMVQAAQQADDASDAADISEAEVVDTEEAADETTHVEKKEIKNVDATKS